MAADLGSWCPEISVQCQDAVSTEDAWIEYGIWIADQGCSGQGFPNKGLICETLNLVSHPSWPPWVSVLGFFFEVSPSPWSHSCPPPVFSASISLKSGKECKKKNSLQTLSWKLLLFGPQGQLGKEKWICSLLSHVSCWWTSSSSFMTDCYLLNMRSWPFSALVDWMLGLCIVTAVLLWNTLNNWMRR